MKKSENTSIVFFGSGPVAERSLRLLAKSFHIEAIITKPTTRRDMVASCPETPVYIASTRKELDAVFNNENFKSKVAVLIDFGIIVSKFVIDRFEKGIINSHFSLLPELRGADPISFAILEGKEITGVSLMILVEAMDEGPLLTTKELKIDFNDTTPNLTNKLIDLSYELICEYLPKYINKEIKPFSQKQNGISYTRKLNKKDGLIDWLKPAEIIEREIRAFVEWPKTRTNFNGIDVIITKSSVQKNMIGDKPGELLIINKELFVYSSTCALKILKLKPAGKKEMTAEAFIAGYRNRI